MIQEIQDPRHLLAGVLLESLPLEAELLLPLAQDLPILLGGSLLLAQLFSLLEQARPLGFKFPQEVPPVLFALAQHLVGVVQDGAGQAQPGRDGEGAALAGMRRNCWAVSLAGFLITCASSSTTRAHSRSASCSTSRTAVP